MGARPLTPTVAATWFIQAVNPPSSYEMAAVVFLIDEPGWTARKTQWSFSASNPAYSKFEFSDSSFRVDLDLDSRELNLIGKRVPLSEANVFVVKRATTAAREAIYQEKLNLSVPFEGDPLRAVVAQSERLRKVLGLD